MALASMCIKISRAVFFPDIAVFFLFGDQGKFIVSFSVETVTKTSGMQIDVSTIKRK